MMSQFRNSMMLYRPALSSWTARKKDKEQSEKTASENGAVAGAANVYKGLLPDNVDLLAVQKWVSGFRTWVYATTLPWDDNGGRVARVERHMDFMQEAGDRIRAGYELVETFINGYAASIEEAKFKLNGLFKQDDYPSVDEVRRKFLFTIDCEAVPDAADFRIIDGLPAEEVQRLVNAATENVANRVGAAIDDLYARLLDVVNKYAQTLDDFGNKRIKKFNDTLVSNISDIAGLVPSLNLTSDPLLDELGKAALALTSYSLKDLRTDEAVRRAAIAEANALVRRFPGGRVADAFAAVAEAVQQIDAAIESERAVGVSPLLGAGFGEQAVREVAEAAAEESFGGNDSATSGSAALPVVGSADTAAVPMDDALSLGQGWGD